MARELVVAAAIVRRARVLAQQRAWPAVHAGRWELPGGRVDDGESEHEALVRECAEELGVRVVPGCQAGPDVPLPNGGGTLRAYAATLADPTAVPLAVEHMALRWLSEDELDAVDWLEADLALLPDLRRLLQEAQPVD